VGERNEIYKFINKEFIIFQNIFWLYLGFKRKSAKGLSVISNFSVGRITMCIGQYVAGEPCFDWTSDIK